MIVFDLTGQRFGRLLAVSATKNTAGSRAWLCQCDCGGNTVALTADLRKGHTKSCGCLCADNMKVVTIKYRQRVTHGRTKAPEYTVWRGMKSRCGNENNTRYSDYGGRGIRVCERWRRSFADFYSDMGPRPSPSHTLDRVDNDRGYEPGNVRWLHVSAQQSNTRRTIKINSCGRILTLTQACAEAGANYSTIRARLRVGLSIQAALGEGYSLAVSA